MPHELLDGGIEQPAVVRELLAVVLAARHAARRHDRHQIVRAELLVDELLRGPPHQVRVLRQRVRLVEHHHVDAAVEAAARWSARRARSAAPRTAAARRARPGCRRATKSRNRLRLAVFEDLEVFLLQIADVIAARVGDERVDLDVVDLDLEGRRRCVPGAAGAGPAGAWPALSDDSGEQRDRARQAYLSTHVRIMPHLAVTGRSTTVSRRLPTGFRPPGTLYLRDASGDGRTRHRRHSGGARGRRPRRLAALRFSRAPIRSPPRSPASADDGGHLATRRWYYLIPASGEPRGLVHAIERHALDAPARQPIARYAGREQLERGLRELLRGVRRVAMEYSPQCAIPYHRARRRGHDRTACASSASTSCRRAISCSGSRRCGTTRAIATHRRASEKLYRVKDRAFDADRASGCAAGHADDRVRHPAADGRLVSRRRARQRLAADRRGRRKRRQPALPADGGRASAPFAPDELVLLDLWGKLDRPGAVFADITWVGYTGARPPERYAQAFAAVAAARDAASRARAARGRGGQRAARLAGGSRRVDRAARRRATAITSCIAPATASASRCTATA